jgi:hypothetical protein
MAQEEVIVAGTGTLNAQGTGKASLRMEGNLRVTFDGKLKIIDRDGDADIQVNGDGLLIVRTRGDAQVYIYRGFNGEANVQGGDFSAKMIGRDIDLTATGTGIAKLRGDGTCSTSGGASGNWSDFATVPLG